MRRYRVARIYSGSSDGDGLGCGLWWCGFGDALALGFAEGAGEALGALAIGLGENVGGPIVGVGLGIEPTGECPTLLHPATIKIMYTAATMNLMVA